MKTPADDAPSWYTDTSEEPHFVDIEDLDAALCEMWTEQGLPELASTSAKIARLAKLYRQTGSETGDVSSEVYAMY
jgi:hypothetical protein